jgi:hypothetical protein
MEIRAEGDGPVEVVEGRGEALLAEVARASVEVCPVEVRRQRDADVEGRHGGGVVVQVLVAEPQQEVAPVALGLDPDRAQEVPGRRMIAADDDGLMGQQVVVAGRTARAGGPALLPGGRPFRIARLPVEGAPLHPDGPRQVVGGEEGFGALVQPEGLPEASRVGGLAPPALPRLGLVAGQEEE